MSRGYKGRVGRPEGGDHPGLPKAPSERRDGRPHLTVNFRPELVHRFSAKMVYSLRRHKGNSSE